MSAFRASTGERLWDIPANYCSRPVINGQTVYAAPDAYDLLTGRSLWRLKANCGCGIAAGGAGIIACRANMVLGYFDPAEHKKITLFTGIRPGCWINAIPAGGLLLVPDYSIKCTCNYPFKTSVALRSAAGAATRPTDD